VGLALSVSAYESWLRPGGGSLEEKLKRTFLGLVDLMDFVVG
jgi:hypothetical protein